MAKVIYNNKECVNKSVDEIVIGTVFSWGSRGEWYVMTVDGAYHLGSGTSLSRYDTLVDYIEATSIEIKTGEK